MARLRINVTEIGNPAWPRWAVRDSRGRYWTGSDWSHDPGSALLYGTEQEADAEAMAMNACVEPRRFVARVEIRVNHDERFSYGELQELLNRSAMSLMMPSHHNLGDAEIEIYANWENLEEIE